MRTHYYIEAIGDESDPTTVVRIMQSEQEAGPSGFATRRHDTVYEERVVPREQAVAELRALRQIADRLNASC